MKYPFYSGLSGKTATIFLVGFILVILPINLFVYNKLQTTIINSDTQQMSAEALKLASQIKFDPVTVPLASTGYYMHVQVFNGQFFQSIFTSPDFPNLTEELYFIETLNIDTLKVFTVQTKIEGSNDELFLSLARSNRTLNVQLTEFRLYLFYITGIAIIVMMILVFAISEIMLRPLKKIVTVADTVQASESMSRLPVPAVHDETRALSITLNNMLARIENSVNTQLQFFDSATHELKTPLTIMRAQLSLAVSNAHDYPTKQILDSILEECERLERTISDFLLLSQLKNDKLSLRMELCDVGEIVFTILAKLKKSAQQKNITIQLTQDSISLSLQADKDKLQTVILNILENAVHYSIEGSIIKVSLFNNEKHIFFEVRNATSKPIQNLDRLGKERYSNSAATRGMGLGLWICNQIISIHKGELFMTESGSEFIVSVQLRGNQ